MVTLSFEKLNFFSKKLVSQKKGPRVIFLSTIVIRYKVLIESKELSLSEFELGLDFLSIKNKKKMKKSKSLSLSFIDSPLQVNGHPRQKYTQQKDFRQFRCRYIDENTRSSVQANTPKENSGRPYQDLYRPKISSIYIQIVDNNYLARKFDAFNLVIFTNRKSRQYYVFFLQYLWPKKLTQNFMLV